MHALLESVPTLDVTAGGVLGALDPRSLLSSLGALGVFLILFAETGLLVGFFLPGDSLLFVAGYATVGGNSLHLHLSLPGVLVLTPIAAVVGAQVGFELGRRAGPALFRRPNSRWFKQEYVERTRAVFEQFGLPRAVVVARFVPIVRTFLNPMAGVVGMAPMSFAGWNAVGGLGWTIGLVLLGHGLGHVAAVRTHVELLVVAVVLLSLLPLLYEVTRRRRRA
jgi:membrane-associated protein